jgi:trans-aconitate 2-methyltransferase
MRVVDLGCGTGELTQLLHRRLQARETLGIDSSPAMLEASRAFAGDGLRFEPAAIEGFVRGRGSALDLVFSNAALQWVPDHEALLPELAALLAPGGQLAVQVPANHDHVSHTLAGVLAREAPFRDEIGGYVRESPVLPPEAYADLLHRSGFAEQQVRLEVYGHQLGSRADVVEWVKGTLLTDYERRLTPSSFARFLEAYRERLLPQLRDERPYFYPFKRILLWARR